MTLVGLVTAMATGALVGIVGHLVVPDGRVPAWPALAAGVAAAVLGTFAARLATPATAGLSVLDVLAPALFAGIGVAVMATDPFRRRSGR